MKDILRNAHGWRFVWAVAQPRVAVWRSLRLMVIDVMIVSWLLPGSGLPAMLFHSRIPVGAKAPDIQEAV